MESVDLVENGVRGPLGKLVAQRRACIAGLDPPFAGGARLASCFTWLVRSVASHYRRTHDATGAFALSCTGPRMPSTLALTVSVTFDLAIRDLRLIRERVRRRGGDPAACCWPSSGWLGGAVYDYVIGRDPFPPVGTRRRKLVVLAEERQAFVPAWAATLAVGVHRAWARGLAWHALWRLPPAMTWSEPGGGKPWIRYPAVSFVAAVRPLQ